MSNTVKMYTMEELLLESNVIKFLDWMIHSDRFKKYMITTEGMTEEEYNHELTTNVGISMLKGKAIELLLEETLTESVWMKDRWS